MHSIIMYVYGVVDSSYREGDLRLVGGTYNWEGRVEVFWSGTWSTIRDTSWTNADATVVCNQFGFIPDGKSLYQRVGRLYVGITPTCLSRNAF